MFETAYSSILRFMQLNPARGRKLKIASKRLQGITGKVYAAQPREGTETSLCTLRGSCMSSFGLCSSTPRGDGNAMWIGAWRGFPHSRFMQLNPARGRKHSTYFDVCVTIWASGLCSSTPRGDGNYILIFSYIKQLFSRFMQLNPARGRKLLGNSRVAKAELSLGLCSSTPRGDGNSHA